MGANPTAFYYLKYRFILKIYHPFHNSCLLFFLCALWFRLGTMIRNLISSLNLFMVCLYSLLPMPILSISLNNSFPAPMIILPEVLTQQSSPPSTLLGHAEPSVLPVSDLKHHILNICGTFTLTSKLPIMELD